MSFFGMDDEEEEQQAEDLAPEQREQVYKTLRARYGNAARDADVREAEDDAAGVRTASMLGQALSGYGSNLLRAKGVQTDDSGGFYDAIRQGADKKVDAARQGRKDRMDKVLTDADLEARDKRAAWDAKTHARQEKDWQNADTVAKAKKDPNSPESKQAQALAQKLMPSGNFAGMSAEQLERSLPTMKDLYEVDQREKSRRDSLNASAIAREEARKDRAAALAESREARQTQIEEDRRYKEDLKRKETDEKKRTALTEVEDRRENINANLDILDKMIAEKGTYEISGSHNQDMERLVDQIATDMAKLQDPQSVARPAEVEQVKKTLVKPGFGNTNDTAREILANFRKEVDRRADTAYKVRGLGDDIAARRKAAGGAGGASGGWGEAVAAPAGGKPKQVIQNGHVYTLNEETGEYE
jgi:hypothetical protein